MSDRLDDPVGVMAHAGRYAGGTALIVLGGPSAKYWQDIYDALRPDVLLGVNGVNSIIPMLDYWLCIENMLRTARRANHDLRAKEFMEMLQRTGANVRLVNRKNMPLMRNRNDVIAVQRRGPFEADQVPADFSFREYGPGLIKGALMKDRKAIGNLKLPVGTVGLQAIHMAGILGCAHVHTIGFDLCFKEGNHHAFKYPQYEPNNYFLPANFTNYEGLVTMRFWVESAEYLLAIKPMMDKVGLEWTDHSDGLLALMRSQVEQ